jgi:hypothetical protein
MHNDQKLEMIRCQVQDILDKSEAEEYLDSGECLDLFERIINIVGTN